MTSAPPRQVPGPTPAWSDVLELVKRFVDEGYAAAHVELPGMRLSMSCTDERAIDNPHATPDAGMLTVPAPVLGVFYRRPAPKAPPFVELGSDVAAETVVAIVEVMKLMVSVTAGVAGQIARVCAEDGEAVEEGQTLFLVAPANDPRPELARG